MKISLRTDFKSDFLPEGCWWPDYDHKPEKCFETVMKHLHDSDFALSKVECGDYCVQAGGHAGFWPMQLAKSFMKVYTFEPDKELFECLTRNVAHCDNIVATNAAVGAYQGQLRYDRRASAGSGQTSMLNSSDTSEGSYVVPVMTIDSLHLPSCGAIFLDVEGFEREVLAGATSTIEAHRPVIQVERGENTPAVEKFLSQFGYEVVKKVGKDLVLLNKNGAASVPMCGPETRSGS